VIQREFCRSPDCARWPLENRWLGDRAKGFAVNLAWRWPEVSYSRPPDGAGSYLGDIRPCCAARKVRTGHTHIYTDPNQQCNYSGDPGHPPDNIPSPTPLGDVRSSSGLRVIGVGLGRIGTGSLKIARKLSHSASSDFTH
jgi:hypothetical protein